MALVVKNPTVNAGDARDTDAILGSGMSPRGERGNLLQLPGESHRERSLVSYGP